MPDSQNSRDDGMVPLLLSISVATGMIDAVSVLGLDKVFTANMTGNVVFLGFALAGAPGLQWWLYVLALLCFAAGAVMGGRVGAHQAPKGRRVWLLTVGIVETALLWLAAGCALLGAPGLGQMQKLIIVALTAIAMGLRNATVRQLKVPDLTTTVLTLTLTGLAADSSAVSGVGSPNFARRLSAVGAILIGALIGALLVIHTGLAVPLAIAGLITIAATLMWCQRQPAQ